MASFCASVLPSVRAKSGRQESHDSATASETDRSAMMDSTMTHTDSNPDSSWTISLPTCRRTKSLGLRRRWIFGSTSLSASSTPTSFSDSVPEPLVVETPVGAEMTGEKMLEIAAFENCWHVVWPDRQPSAMEVPPCVDAVIVVHVRGSQHDTGELVRHLRKVEEGAPILVVLLDTTGAEAKDFDYVLAQQQEFARDGADDIVCGARSQRELTLALSMAIRRRDIRLAAVGALRTEVQRLVTERMEELEESQSSGLFWQSAGMLLKGFPEMDHSLPRQISDGTHIGPCSVTSTSLGQGIFGKVYSAVNKTTETHEAIKVISKASIKQRSQVTSLHREMCLHKRLRHRHIVELYGVHHGPRHIFIRMEAASSKTLFHVIKDASGLLSECLAKRYGRQLVEAVAYCHKQGVAHRDLKPENIAMDAEGLNIKVLDFGCSAHTCRERTDMVGSFPFMAPEIFIATADRPYEPSGVDVWSCGVILVELLCGLRHFDRLMGWDTATRATTRRYFELVRFFAEEQPVGQKLVGHRLGAVPADLEELFRGVFVVGASKRCSAARAAKSAWFSPKVA